MSSSQIDGFIQSLRDTEQIKADSVKPGTHAAGGYIPVLGTNTPFAGKNPIVGDLLKTTPLSVTDLYSVDSPTGLPSPPGLQSPDFDFADTPSLTPSSTSTCLSSDLLRQPLVVTEERTPDSPSPNPFVGITPDDINEFNFTLPGNKFRSLLFGRDDWLAPMDKPALNLIPSFDQIEDQRDSEILFKPFTSLIHVDLHCTLINWLDHSSCMKDGAFEAGLATGLRKVMSHGNSKLRKHASEALANLHCLDRYHAGDAGVCRITWGELIKLDDCTCQHVSIGPSIFAQSIMGIQSNSTNFSNANSCQQIASNATNAPC